MAAGRTLVLFFAIAYTWAWLIFVPVAWWTVTVQRGGPVAVIGVVVFYLAVLGVAFVWRFSTGAWRKIELVEPEPQP